jgi:hypothetical protein
MIFVDFQEIGFATLEWVGLRLSWSGHEGGLVMILRDGVGERREGYGTLDGWAVLLEAVVGYRGVEFWGGDLSSRDSPLERGVSDVGIAVQDGEGGNRVCCTSMIRYEGPEETRFPDLVIRIEECG